MLVYNVHHIKASKKQYNWSHFSNKKEFFRHKNERKYISRMSSHNSWRRRRRRSKEGWWCQAINVFWLLHCVDTDFMMPNPSSSYKTLRFIAKNVFMDDSFSCLLRRRQWGPAVIVIAFGISSEWGIIKSEMQ